MGQAEGHHQVAAQRALAVADGLGQDLGHAAVALDPGRDLGVAAAHADRVDQVGQHRELDAGLAERWQHLLDVAEEEPVGPDDQHALVLQREAVRVEEVGGPVEGDDGLAGAGTALHHEHAGHAGPG